MGKTRKSQSGSRAGLLKPQEVAVLRAVRALLTESSEVCAPVEAIFAALPDRTPTGIRAALSKLHRLGVLGVIDLRGTAVTVYSSPEAMRQGLTSINKVIGQARRGTNLSSVRPPQQELIIEAAASLIDEGDEAEAEVLDTLTENLEERDVTITALQRDLRRSLNKQRVAEEREEAAEDRVNELRGQLGLVKAELSDTKRLLAERTAEAERVPELEEEIRRLKVRTIVTPELAERLRNLDL